MRAIPTTFNGTQQEMREKPMTESMRKYIRGGLAAAFAMAALPLASASAQAADYDVGSIHITQPWTRATPKGASSGAGYLIVTNSGTAPDRLSCAGTDVAAQCQIHTMSMENGPMKMRLTKAANLGFAQPPSSLPLLLEITMRRLVEVPNPPGPKQRTCCWPACCNI